MEKKTLRQVDGFKIRNTLDIDFGLLHEASSQASYFAPKFYIPEHEIWLDHRFKDEKDFLLKLEELETPDILKTYSAQRQYIKKALCISGPVPPYRISQSEEGELTIVMVDGKIIRTHFDPEFIFGGHEFVYSYIPPREIWLDNLMDTDEVQYVLLHEKVERELMSKGKTYDIGHEYASVAEKEMRRTTGAGAYLGDDGHPWWGYTNEQLAQEYYVE